MLYRISTFKTEKLQGTIIQVIRNKKSHITHGRKLDGNSQI